MNKEFKPVVLHDYIPSSVKRIMNKIPQGKNYNYALVGFSLNMKWLSRIFKDNNLKFQLFDWRENYFKHDCGGLFLKKLEKNKLSKKTIIIICNDQVNELKDCILYLFEKKINYPTYYETEFSNSPYYYEWPYNEIAKRAEKRAKSMISEWQLYDLMQIIQQTSDIEGDVVEFGSLYGGSGAIIAEAMIQFEKKINKKLYLLDSFMGIPKSKYGLDETWNGSFSDNSFAEVKSAFKDLKFVEVIQGNITKTYKRIMNKKISFCYLASDTLESGEIILNNFWENISKGGVIIICDYGSFPNAAPLTAYVDSFINKINDAYVYKPYRFGAILIKK